MIFYHHIPKYWIALIVLVKEVFKIKKIKILMFSKSQEEYFTQTILHLKVDSRSVALRKWAVTFVVLKQFGPAEM